MHGGSRAVQVPLWGCREGLDTLPLLGCKLGLPLAPLLLLRTAGRHVFGKSELPFLSYLSYCRLSLKPEAILCRCSTRQYCQCRFGGAVEGLQIFDLIGRGGRALIWHWPAAPCSATIRPGWAEDTPQSHIRVNVTWLGCTTNNTSLWLGKLHPCQPGNIHTPRHLACLTGCPPLTVSTMPPTCPA